MVMASGPASCADDALGRLHLSIVMRSCVLVCVCVCVYKFQEGVGGLVVSFSFYEGRLAKRMEWGVSATSCWRAKDDDDELRMPTRAGCGGVLCRMTTSNPMHGDTNTQQTRDKTRQRVEYRERERFKRIHLGGGGIFSRSTHSCFICIRSCSVFLSHTFTRDIVWLWPCIVIYIFRWASLAIHRTSCDDDVLFIQQTNDDKIYRTQENNEEIQ